MKTLGFIIQKEFKQIFRNKAMLPIIFILPLIQLLILSNAATFEVKDVKFSFIDHDHSSMSRGLVEKFSASPFFNIVNDFPSSSMAVTAMLKGEVDVILEIPNHFERDLSKNKGASLGLSINAIDGAAAGIQNVYINQIILNYNRDIRLDLMLNPPPLGQIKNITSIPSFWYNETLNYKTFMVPGILVMLVTMITLFLSGMNIVREKEIGTLEQINVTPIKKSQFIIGKR